MILGTARKKDRRNFLERGCKHASTISKRSLQVGEEAFNLGGNMKRTKIVCTIGPSSESPEMLEQMMLEGMDVCRLNFSHGTHEEHQERIDNIKEIRQRLQLPVGIMLDTKGPEIRIGRFAEGRISLEPGDILTLTPDDILGDKNRVHISYKNIASAVLVGSRILIDDGLVELEVIEIVDGKDVRAMAKNYGELSDRKGVNIPSAIIDLPAITPRDIDDIRMGIANEVDYIAASFIRKKEDVFQIREVLERYGGKDIGIISKIESEEGVNNLTSIIKASDGIMVARGDLGVEIHTEQLPLVQKEIILKANIEGKPVITATQMLDSMIRNPRPTRAEVTDVANAILDGTDAVMLSGETAAGKYALESLQMMRSIALSTETSIEFERANFSRRNWRDGTTPNAISRSTCSISDQLRATAIITATSSGATAKAVSKFRPKAPIIATTENETTYRKLSMVWGVRPVITEVMEDSTDTVLDNSVREAMKHGFVREGDLVILTAGLPVGISGTTNLIKVHTVARELLRGTGIGDESVTGRACLGNTAEELEGKFTPGDIIVARYTDADLVRFISEAAAVIVEEGGLTSHAAIAGISLNKPVIVGAADATKIIEDDQLITIDARTGLVYKGVAKL